LVFRFEHADWPVDDNVRRAARNEFDSAIGEVAETGFEVHATVRNVRRRLKRVRAILRLIRPVFADYREENIRLRDTGAEFSSLRDAMALVEAVDLLALKAKGDEAIALERVRAALTKRAADSEGQLDRETFLTSLRSKLRDARVRSELWELKSTGRKALVPGVVEGYRRAREAFGVAEAAPDSEALHELRKHVKYHLAHLSLLRDLAPAFADGRRKEMQKLARGLGDLQNLAVLDAVLVDDNVAFEDGDKSVARSLLERRVQKLRRKALAAGERLLGEKPDVVEARWSVYWDDWQAGRKLAAD
jgi:hypothetical protein